jgi:hypothetical protein
MPKPRILFICKQRPARYGASYGLLNSCRFLSHALQDLGAEAKLEEVEDNNRIDHALAVYKPTHVFIEALWVVPEKFEVLIPLHPKVQWHVRLHSNTPFIANEGSALEWILKYDILCKKYPRFHIAVNSTHMESELALGLGVQTVYAPNVYAPYDSHLSVTPKPPLIKSHKELHISSFGSIRPLKNQLIQAMAAMAFADEQDKVLRFHVNDSRIENNGSNVFKNLTSLFAGSKHSLVCHDWLSHEDFIDLVKQMDLGLQVSFSETFNIVAADHVASGVPLVGSKEITWLNPIYQANPTSIESILLHLRLAWLGRKLDMQTLNSWGLTRYNRASVEVWKNYLNL